MRFGVFYEHQLPRPWEDGDEERLLLDALEQIEIADRIGLDHVWEVEHHFLEEYSHSSAPEVFLAAASQRTDRIRLGHGIVQLPPAVNHPARVAERIATLDLLSGGRVEFGTGEGSSQAELGGFGVGRDDKHEQWEEALDVVVRMLTEEPFTGHRGRWIDVPPRNVIPKPKQRPHPPLWMACSRREAIELAGTKGVGALSFSFVDPEDAKPFVDAYYAAITSPRCIPAGKAVNANVAVVVPFMCHEDEETAIERGIDGAHFFGYSLAHYYVFGEHRPGRTNVMGEFERYRAERGYARDIIRPDSQALGMKVLQEGLGSLRGAVGTPDQVADLIGRYEAVGVDEVIFVAAAGPNRHEHICESLELFGEQVLPRFADGRGGKEAAKRERLSGAIDAALARRRERDEEIGDYTISPQGELRPAPRARPLHDGRTRPVPGEILEMPKHLVRKARQRVLHSLVSRATDDQLERYGSKPAALRALFGSMGRMIEPEALGDTEATIRYELAANGTTYVWTVRVADGRAGTRPGGGEDADTVLRLRLADFLRIAAGELTTGQAVMDDRIDIEGDLGKLSKVNQAMGRDI
ncbi:MAG: LLM class flavin-dependent oxidoreductase [Nitriliruptorales bacterium]